MSRQLPILRLAALFASLAFGACAALHRTQLADVDPPGKGKKISVRVSETTLDLQEIASLAKAGGQIFNSKGATSAGNALDTYTALFQFGPRTGTPVYTEAYARIIPELLREKCPQGRVVNIMSTRETREYPVVKGEIIRIDADCVN